MFCRISNKVLCMRLHTASVVIGWLSAVISLVLSMSCIGILVNFNRIIEAMSAGHYEQELVSTVSSQYTILFSVISAVYFLNFAASILMIYGANTNSHRMLLPWLIHNGILLGLQGLLNSALLVLTACVNPGDLQGLINLIVISIILGIGWFAWRVILSLFHHIRASKDKEGFNNLSNHKLLNFIENDKNDKNDVQRY